jgi:predicted transcriptional regulator
MGRRPGDPTRQRQQPEGRTLIWRAIRFLRQFDLEELESTSGQSHANVQKYVLRLAKAGYLRLTTKADGQPGKANTYRLIRNTGQFPPMPEKTGGVFDLNLNQVFGDEFLLSPETGRCKAWEKMRQSDTFTVAELATVMSLSGARAFVGRLNACGYLERIEAHGGEYYRYRLVRDTGPSCPIVKRQGSIYDPNLNQYMEIHHQ